MGFRLFCRDMRWIFLVLGIVVFAEEASVGLVLGVLSVIGFTSPARVQQSFPPVLSQYKERSITFKKNPAIPDVMGMHVPTVQYLRHHDAVRPKYSPPPHSLTKEDDILVIIDHFDKLLSSTPHEVADFPLGPRLSDRNFFFFQAFFSNTSRNIDIMTNVVDMRLLSELLNPLRNKEVKVRILTRRVRNEKYLEFLKEKLHVSVDLRKNNRLHAKFMIRDGDILATGSSNLSDASMSKSGFFYDANVLTRDSEAIATAKSVFDSVWFNKDRTHKKHNCRFIYSRAGNDEFPESLREYFIRETEGIYLLMSTGLIDKQVLAKVAAWNVRVPIKMFIGDNWPEGVIDEHKVRTLQYMQELIHSSEKNVLILPRRLTIHAKLYLFKSQNIAIISSLNLTVDSWRSLLESAYIIDDPSHVKNIADDIDALPMGRLPELKNLTLVDKPEESWQGTRSEKKVGIPWALPESTPGIDLVKMKSVNYFRIGVAEIVKNLNSKIDEFKENVGEREGADIKRKTNAELKEYYRQKFGRASRTARYKIWR